MRFLIALYVFVSSAAVRSGVVGRVVLATAVAVTVVGLGTADASGAGKSNRPAITFISPSPSEGATLATNSVQFAFTYNRRPKQTQTLVCALSGPTSSSGACDAPAEFGTKGSVSGKAYTGLANGSYTFVVSLTLTDGGTTSATRHFTITVPVRHIYWTNPTGSIGRANVDGTGKDASFITGLQTGFPEGMAVDGNYIYWANLSQGIGRANLDGTGVNESFISGVQPGPVDVAVDGNHVYWGNHDDAVGRANLDGTGVNESFISGLLLQTDGVAVDGSHVYWSSSFGAIGRANLDGTGVNQSFITTGAFSAPVKVAVDGNYIYWANGESPDSIGRANLDGTGVNLSFIVVGPDLGGIAVDGNYIYWANFGTGMIGRANLDGTGVNQSFMFITIPSGPLIPFDVAVDAG
jgi:hypothetical protein